MKIIDLSREISEETEVYPGDPPIEISPWAKIEEDGYYMNILKMGEHAGTHVDAPAHFIMGGETIDRLPLDKFVGEGVVVDVRGGKGHIRAEEIPKNIRGMIVLLLTNGRELSKEASERLVRENVKAVGTDSLTIGNEEVHKILLSAKIPIFEGLTNLEELLGKEFLFIGFPLKIKRGSGSPIRAVAIIGGI
ncbi:cyclase family protein [Pyrococcus sp. ST04]|uniref:cyclase family protein n=1 Tax=Pyrococcus sp. ST04 TaxID=1183377 RepID=UPI0002605885|nr:cyclase family protein [Pyrococcus sp. ST04]AFK22186.1 cyclase-related protein [Pyrococcus sp. ST04]